MRQIQYTQPLPVLAEAQVCVVGSGPAGVSAAIASSRVGAETLLVERYGCCGGALSVGMVQSYSFSTNRNPSFLSGIPLEIEQRVRAANACQDDYRGSGVLIEQEQYKLLLDNWLRDENVRVLGNAKCCATLCEGGRLDGIVVATKEGLGAILAKAFVDATGDGDVAAFAGAEILKRPPEQLQPVTVVFGVSGVDVALYKNHVNAHSDRSDPDYGWRKPFRLSAEKGDWKSAKRGGAWKIVTPNGDITSFNIIAIRNVDATDPFAATQAEIEGREQAAMAVEVLRKYGADIGFANCTLRNIAVQLGVRETRRVVGDYILTGDDVLSGREFPDAVGRFLRFMDTYGEIHRPEHGESFAIPYRALLPKGLDGLLVAGRCISCDERAFGSIRLMPCCAVTGQAAGTAAAFSALNGVTTRGVDLEMLQRRLPLMTMDS